MKTRKKCRSPMYQIGKRHTKVNNQRAITHAKYITETGFCQTEVSHG